MGKAGQRQLRRPAAAARLGRSFEDLHAEAGPGQGERASQAVRPGSDDDCVEPAHRRITSPSAASATGTGLARRPAASFSSSVSVRSGR